MQTTSAGVLQPRKAPRTVQLQQQRGQRFCDQKNVPKVVRPFARTFRRIFSCYALYIWSSGNGWGPLWLAGSHCRGRGPTAVARAAWHKRCTKKTLPAKRCAVRFAGCTARRVHNGHAHTHRVLNKWVRTTVGRCGASQSVANLGPTPTTIGQMNVLMPVQRDFVCKTSRCCRTAKRKLWSTVVSTLPLTKLLPLGDLLGTAGNH